MCRHKRAHSKPTIHFSVFRASILRLLPPFALVSRAYQILLCSKLAGFPGLGQVSSEYSHRRRHRFVLCGRGQLHVTEWCAGADEMRSGWQNKPSATAMGGRTQPYGGINSQSGENAEEFAHKESLALVGRGPARLPILHVPCIAAVRAGRRLI